VRRIPPLAADAAADLVRDRDRFTGVTHPERFTAIPDPDDRAFAGLAHAAGAVLISNDAHLLDAGGGGDLTVLTPRGFRERYPRAMSR
jgi:predicted nucleic acid-binding protein